MIPASTFIAVLEHCEAKGVISPGSAMAGYLQGFRDGLAFMAQQASQVAPAVPLPALKAKTGPSKPLEPPAPRRGNSRSKERDALIRRLWHDGITPIIDILQAYNALPGNPLGTTQGVYYIAGQLGLGRRGAKPAAAPPASAAAKQKFVPLCERVPDPMHLLRVKAREQGR